MARKGIIFQDQRLGSEKIRSHASVGDGELVGNCQNLRIGQRQAIDDQAYVVRRAQTCRHGQPVAHAEFDSDRVVAAIFPFARNESAS